jgi:hypothetical protein
VDDALDSRLARFDPFTIAGMCAVGAVCSLNLSLGLFYGRTFAAMFRDFGSELPAITVLELSPVWHLGWAAVLTTAAFAVPFLAAQRATRLLVLAGLLVASAILVALFFFGMYSPIFALAGSIQ